MSRYVINVLASQDLNEIADYFAENSLEVGERFFRAFNAAATMFTVFSRFVLEDIGWDLTPFFVERRLSGNR